MRLILKPIETERKLMEQYLDHEFCEEVFKVYETFCQKVGFNRPWIGYFALYDNQVLGVGGYMGAPAAGKVETGYGTVPGNEGRGIATEICRQLTNIALAEVPHLTITARTLRKENASTNILRKCRFKLLGTAEDPEYGLAWEWEFSNTFPAK